MHLGNAQGDTLAGVDCDASLLAVLKLIETEADPFDLFLITGDIAHFGAESAYRRLKDYLTAIGVPIAMLPGNHDDAVALASVFGELPRRMVMGNWQCIFLDSNGKDENNGYLDDEELAFLEHALAKPMADHSMIALHHQPVDIGSRWIDTMQLENKQLFFDIVDKYANTRLVIWGHVHQAFDAWHRQVRLLSSPSTCTQFLPMSDIHLKDDLKAGYRWLDLKTDGTMETGIVRVV